MSTTTERIQGRRTPWALTIAVMLGLLVALLLAGPALAGSHEGMGRSATPGKPTAKAPKGTITQAKPAFKWSKVSGATKYDVRVYQGSKRFCKPCVTKTSWKCTKALPKNVALTWKVRARNARGAGAWSKISRFKVVPPSPPSSAKAITAFSFVTPAVTGVLDEAAHTIAVTVPFGTNVTALVATFTTTGVSVAVGGTPQVSGTTANSFTSPVTYTVTAADGTTQAYVVTVTVAVNSAKAITAFSFAAPAATGVINETLHTIAVTVPYGTSVTALVPTITITGASVSPASGVANNFSTPRTYTVTAADVSTQDYLVTVTVAALPATKYLVTSSESTPVAGAAVTISAQLADASGDPVATPGNVVTWTKSNANGSFATATSTTDAGGLATVALTTHAVAGTATTVTAATGSLTGTSAVIVTAPAIGASYQGGKVAYILQPSDPGYVPGEARGLIAATADQSAAIQWYNGAYLTTGTSLALGAGLANTDAIIAAQGPTATDYAAGLARAYDGGGYTDWYLPSEGELDKLYRNQAAIGGFASDIYWSSSEHDATIAWYVLFDPESGTHGGYDKNNWDRVRAVRSFVASSPKAITAFSFASPAVSGVINETAHTIALTVPYGTSVTALVPTIAINGASVNPASGVANSFSTPRTYTVTAADGTTQAYLVTVTVALNPAKAITAFSFATPAATGVITEASHTIAVTVPYGTSVTALVPTIAITGASVSPASGVANNFSTPRTYTVTAGDGTTQAYTVTVTVASLTIGDSYLGGKVAYILQGGDPGYVPGETHGLIAAVADQPSGIRWYNGSYTDTGATGTLLGAGPTNTTVIILSQGSVATSYAAGLARACADGGYADWYLPSKDELNKLYMSRGAIGGFGSGAYWSSSESTAIFAWAQFFNTGAQGEDSKGATWRVRPVRSF